MVLVQSSMITKFSPLFQTDRHLVVDTTEGVLQLFPKTYKTTGCRYWIGVSGRGGVDPGGGVPVNGSGMWD